MNNNILEVIPKIYKLKETYNKILNLHKVYTNVGNIQLFLYLLNQNNNFEENLYRIKNDLKKMGYNIDNLDNYDDIINYLESIKENYKNQAIEIVIKEKLEHNIENYIKNIFGIR